MRVALREIASRDRYSPTFLPELEPLKASLREVGLLEPLVLREGVEGWEVVLGLKRLLALEALGWEEAEVRVFPSRGLQPHEAARWAVAHNLPSGLNIVEKARAVVRLEGAGVPQEEVVSRWLPLLGLGPQMSLYRKLKGLLDLPPALQAYLVEGEVSLSAAWEFLAFDMEELQALAPMILTLRPGDNKLKEILRSLRDLSLRERTAVGELVEEAEQVWADPKRTRPERLQSLRRWLRRRRYPRLSQLEAAFEGFCSRMGLPQGVLRPPPSFEGEEFTVQFRFSSKEEFLRMAEGLREAALRMASEPSDPFRPFKGLP